MDSRLFLAACALVLLSGAGCGNTPSPNEGATARIIFAANLASGGNCDDRDAENACDLYGATLDLETGTPTNVRRVTDTEQSESYPAWNPNGDAAYFTVFHTPRSKDIGYVDLASGETILLLKDAAWATVHPAGNLFLYVSAATDMIMQAVLQADGITLGEAVPLTRVANQQDPDFSRDGRYVVFHETGGAFTHGTVYDRETGLSVSHDTRSGHCTFGTDGLILCDNARGGGIFSRSFENGELGANDLFLADMRPSDIAEYDPDMGECDGTSFNYPTFCGDDDHLLVSASCSQGGSVAYSRLFLIVFSEEAPRYLPVGKYIAEAFGGPGNSTWTVDCLAQP